MIADLARNAAFPASEFERVRRQKLEDVRIERTTPRIHRCGAIAPRAFRRASIRHRRAQRSAEWNPTAASNFRNFTAAHYVPSDALLVIVGDFNTPAMLGLIEKTFRRLERPVPGKTRESTLRRIYTAAGECISCIFLEVCKRDVLVGNRAITRRDPDWYRLGLANSIYGGAFNSRLVMNIREQKGYTYSPRSGISALREYGYFTVHAAVRNDVVAATLTEIFYEMDRMRSLPVGDAELNDARNYMTGVFSLGVATQEGMIGQLSTVYLNRLAR